MTQVPPLAPPGAGLPFPESLVARLIFAVKKSRGSREAFVSQLRLEQARAVELVASLPPERRGERVLIPRLRGMEDSSRHWSVWMTLDHLRICNDAFAGVIAALAAEKVPPGRASTADVKPSPAADEAVEETFATACGRLLETAAHAPGTLRTRATFVHPWFGALDAFGWLALAAHHMTIHRRQLEAIVARLA